MQTIDERTLKQKFDDWWLMTKFRARGKWFKVKTFCRNNSGAIFSISIIALPGILSIANSMIRRNTVIREDKRRLCDIWDPRRGQHYQTKKPMTASQQLEYARRYDLGENGAEILRSMKLI